MTRKWRTSAVRWLVSAKKGCKRSRGWQAQSGCRPATPHSWSLQQTQPSWSATSGQLTWKSLSILTSVRWEPGCSRKSKYLASNNEMRGWNLRNNWKKVTEHYPLILRRHGVLRCILNELRITVWLTAPLQTKPLCLSSKTSNVTWPAHAS